MNVWIINHYIPYPNSGSWGRHNKLADELKEKQNVTLICGSYVPKYNKNNIKFPFMRKIQGFSGVKYQMVWNNRYYGNGISRYLSMVTFMLSTILHNVFVSKKSKPSVIIASSVHPLSWISGRILAKLHNAKFIAETRDVWPDTLIDMKRITRTSKVAKLLYMLESSTYIKSDALIFTMPGGKEYCEKYNIHSDKIYYINNGVDVELYDMQKSDLSFHIEDFDDTKFNVFYTGTVSHYNGIDYLIDAAKEIQQSGYNDIHIYIVGDGLLLEKITNQAMEYHLSNVTFLGDIEKKYIPSILSKSDLNLLLGVSLPLNRFGFSPNKLFDYFASGKPILSNRFTKYDYVVESNSGITVLDESATSIANGMIYFKDLKENYKSRYTEFCENSRKQAHVYSFKELGAKLNNLIERVEANE